MRLLWEPTEAQRLWSSGKLDKDLLTEKSSVLWIDFGIFGALVLVFGFRYWRLRAGLVHLASERDTLLDFAEAFESLGPNGNFEFLLADLNRFLIEKRGGVEWSGLTDTEREVFLATKAGIGAKEIASATSRNPASICNIRSRIRRKLGIPGDANLEDWFAQMDSKS